MVAKTRAAWVVFQPLTESSSSRPLHSLDAVLPRRTAILSVKLPVRWKRGISDCARHSMAAGKDALKHTRAAQAITV